MKDYYQKLTEAKNFLAEKLMSFSNEAPKALVVLGSGLGHFALSFEEQLEIEVSEIPHFKSPSVSGHSGKIIFVKDDHGHTYVLQSGRLHFYEGHNYHDINFPLRAIRLLGVNDLVLTNSAGSLNPNFSPGDLVIIKDHINFSGFNPLVGENISEIGPRFPDMTNVYDSAYVEMAKTIAERLNIHTQTGTYFHVSGPSYETPAEVKLFYQMGGDMVGMSTVPEAIAAKHAGYKILGISCITNFGAGLIEQTLTHEDVKHEAAKAGTKFSNLVREFLKNSVK